VGSIARETDTPIHGLFSPEGVRLELPIAGPAPRMFAYGVDFFIIAAVFIFMAIVLITTLPIDNAVDGWMSRAFHEASRQVAQQKKGGPADFGVIGGVVVALFVLAQFIIETGYFIFWEMVTNGRSPGKILGGLRVVRRDGLPINLRSSVLRNVLRIVDILPANYAVGLASILLSASGERLGDHVAGTIVIRLDRPQAALVIEPSQKGVTLALTRAQLARIGPREIQLIRATLHRVPNLSTQRSNDILNQVADTMRVRLELTDLPVADPLTFLRDLMSLAERYSRD
jgi:uncharacterized RDD family membrane protein YckC